MFLFNMQPWGYILLWLAVVIVAIIIEIETVQMVSVWFAASGLATMILAAFECGFEVQIIVFVSLSVGLFLLSRPIVKKLHKTSSQNSTVESLVGEEVVVIKEIKVGEVGEIKAKYEKYSAIAPNSLQNIPVNAKCIIKEVRGNKVIVEKI